jgi:2-polyprenyl-6-methoxyphenol hydroxylase-like FAD-dependent oxidoreductase
VKIIILGAGQVGRTAAYHLSREEANDVTVVDSDDDVLRDLQDRLDIRTVSGNAANPSMLEAPAARTRTCRRADEQRRSEHGRLPGRVDAVQDADQDRAHPRALVPEAPRAVRPEARASRWTCRSAPSSWSPSTSYS